MIWINLKIDNKKIKNTIAVNSCTAALHLSLLAIQLKKGEEVILIYDKLN